MNAIRYFILILLCLYRYGSLQAMPVIDTSLNHPLIDGKEKYRTVYICSGSYAYAYHSISNCPGLNNCHGQIYYTDESSAINRFHRVPCCRCWSNVSGNCKEDNPPPANYGGGSGGEGYGVFALVIASTSAIILSNDFYLHYTYSFPTEFSFINLKGVNNAYGTGVGMNFGFRKTFKHSALEYGATRSIFYHTQGVNTRFQNAFYEKRWGGQLSYVHQLFFNKFPDNLKMYAGPTLSYVYKYGYGGILGFEMKLADRWKMDIRYERTTQTNQFQIGFFFKYQKKYLWQK